MDKTIIADKAIKESKKDMPTLAKINVKNCATSRAKQMLNEAKKEGFVKI